MVHGQAVEDLLLTLARVPEVLYRMIQTVVPCLPEVCGLTLLHLLNVLLNVLNLPVAGTARITPTEFSASAAVYIVRAEPSLCLLHRQLHPPNTLNYCLYCTY